MNDPESTITHVLEENPTLQLREELGTNASVYYIPPKEGV
jgi:hypothetical protein